MLTHILSGFGSLFSITTPPLYRYPYRFNDEGLRGDMGRVAEDIGNVIQPNSQSEEQ